MGGREMPCERVLLQRFSSEAQTTDVRTDPDGDVVDPVGRCGDRVGWDDGGADDVGAGDEVVEDEAAGGVGEGGVLVWVELTVAVGVEEDAPTGETWVFAFVAHAVAIEVCEDHS